MKRGTIKSLVVVTIAWSIAIEKASSEPDAPGVLHETIAFFEPYLGAWELDGAWENGNKLWSYAEYEAIVGGRFVMVSTWVRDGGGEPYLRYQSVFGPAENDGEYRAINFHRDGTTSDQHYQRMPSGELALEWEMRGATIKESLGEVTGDEFAWKVMAVAPNTDREQLLMDAVWNRAEPGQSPSVETKPLSSEMEPLSRFVGRWEVRTKWANGQALWARNTLCASPDGTYLVSEVRARDGSGPEYDRYRTFYTSSTDANQWREITFSHTGGWEENQAEMGDDGTVTTTIPPTASNPLTIQKRVSLENDRSYRAIVRARSSDGDEWRTILDGTWLREETTGMTRPIDPDLFAASGVGVRSFEATEVIAADRTRVYTAFTDGEVFAKTYAPGRTEIGANIELAIGGDYEWLFDGEVGSNGCQVLSYIPNRMVSFSWNAPETQAESRAKRTWVVVEFTETEEQMTHVRITHLGFGEEAHWAETFSYFQRAWPVVLSTFKKNLEEESRGS